jgi:L-arabinose isomerase
MINLKKYEFYFVTGSQDLYGAETLRKVDEHSKAMVEALDPKLPCKLIWKPVVKGPDAILALVREANSNPNCAGIITWMHTFSPSKMWIAGLTQLAKPLCHLHTQFNRDIPWDSIDMDFMNLNQSAHGDREHGFIGARLRLPRKVVVGHWEAPAVLEKLSGWMRTASAFADGRSLKVARFGDNMREVAVTEGDKVEAQIKLGWSINGYGVGDLVKVVKEVSDAEVEKLVKVYADEYEIAADAKAGAGLERVKVQARIELGLKTFLEAGKFGAYTDTFEDLHGLAQLPGLASQRMMAAGYGFGAEGDWKTSALVRAMKVMASGLGGASFLEDYTYNLDPAAPAVLGSHMLEICPSIAKGKPRLEVHPLGIGGKDDPARLVFAGDPGPALNATLVDMGGRMRLILNEVDAIEAKAMPKLPVARVLLKPRPDLERAAESWIIAGGAHHTGYSRVVKTEWMRDWAEMASIECLVIDAKTDPNDLRKEIRWNEIGYKLGL